ncbi:MAG: hypothetical protein ABSF37_03375 [Sedimentisphaerales bacterium]|jgi:hypothetical protein
MELKELSKISPPYIPWETLKNFLKILKESATPNRIDSSMMPSSMSGFSKAGVMSALKFFSLIDSSGGTTKNLKQIADAMDTDGWAEAIKRILMPAYANIIGDLKLDTATRNELNEKFGETSLEMKDRFIRFYIPMLQDAGEKISPYLTLRQNRQSKGGPKKIAKKQSKEPLTSGAGEGGQSQQEETPSGFYDQPIPITSDTPCYIRVPRNITTDQMGLVDAAVAFIKAMASHNKEGKK